MGYDDDHSGSNFISSLPDGVAVSSILVMVSMMCYVCASCDLIVHLVNVYHR